MRILIVSNISDRSESYFYSELVRRGHKVDIVCDPRETKISNFREAGANAYVLKIKHRLDTRAAWFLRDLIKLYQYDIVYTPFNKGLAACALAVIGTSAKLVAYRGTLGNISYLNPADYLTYLNPRLSAVACNCKAVRESLSAYRISPKKLHAIYKGHDLKWYEYQNAPLRSDFNIPESSFVIGCITNVRPLKGINILLDAFEQTPTDIQPHLMLIGKSGDKKTLSLIKNHKLADQIHCTGFRSDAAHIAGIFDVAVMPSLRREGLPRSIIETMAQKIPAVVTDVGGMPGLVDHGKAGLIVPSNNATELAQAITSLAVNKDKRAELGENAKKHLIKNFDITNYVDNMTKLFRSLL